MRAARIRARRHRPRPSVLVAAVAVALVAGGSVPAGARTPSATVRGTSGDALATLGVQSSTVEIKPAGKRTFVDARDGRRLEAGDTIRTSDTGRAEIVYGDGSLTRLDVSTEYRLGKLSAKKGTRKTKGVQTAGQTWHRVEALSGNDSYKVEGANATAAVLGTAFAVDCPAVDQCTFTAVVDPITVTDAGPRNGTKTVTLTPGDQAIVSDDAIGPVTTLTQEDLLAIRWIVENLLSDQAAGLSPGTSEVADQDDPPPTRPASSPVVEPPPPAPTVGTPTVGTPTVGDPEPPPPANEGPTANDDGYAMPEDTLLVIAAPGVLANDVDPEGAPLELFLTGLPAHGSLTVFADGAFVYFPDPNFHGVDTFTYVAGDGIFGSNPATVTITVTPVNDVPVATDDAYTTDEDTALEVVAADGVLANDSDVDGDPLTADIEVVAAGVALGTPTEHGMVVLDEDGSFVYTPDPDFHGTDSFQYVALDAESESNVATVTITVAPVNDAPTVADDAYTTDQDTPLVVDAPGPLDNDVDVDDDDLTLVLVDDVTEGALEAESDGSFTYTPDEGFTGTDSFTYRAADAATQSALTATVTITVEPLVFPTARPKIYQLDAGDSVTFGFDAWDATSFVVDTLPTGGTLLLGPAPVSPGQDVGVDPLTYVAPFEPGTYSFTWHGVNDDGESVVATQYFLVGLPPLMPDLFVYSPDGEPATAEVYVTFPDGLPPLTCAISDSGPYIAFDGFVYDEGGTLIGFRMVYDPPDGAPTEIVSFAVNACFGDGYSFPDEGGVVDSGAPEATIDRLTRVYVAVGYDDGAEPENPVPAPLVEIVDVPESLGPEDTASFSIRVTEEQGLPLSWTLVEGEGAPFGTLVETGTEGNLWFFDWTPGYFECEPIVVTIRFSNGFTTADADVTLPYGCDIA